MSEQFFCGLKSAASSQVEVIHRDGLPDEGDIMGWPAWLLMLPDPEGGVMLFRVDGAGTVVGDTWHRNLDDAKHQAEFEYGDSLDSWTPLPDEVGDLRAAIAFLATRPS